MELILIAALAENRAIGYKGKIPWKLTEDLKRFRQLTLNHTVLMGRKTYDSIGKPLDKRKNIVLTRDKNFNSPGVIVCYTLEDALKKCEKDETVYVIGGEQVYRSTIDMATRLELTLVKKNYEGDAFFPEINNSIWHKIKEEDKGDYSFSTYVKINLERLLKAL